MNEQMPIESDLAAARERYACKTKQRMAHTIDQLRWIQRGDEDNVEVESVVEHLRRQQEASRLAGFIGIWRLCRDAEECLAEVCPDEPARLAAVAGRLLNICRAIELHAEAVGRSLMQLRDDGAHRRTVAQGIAVDRPRRLNKESGRIGHA